MASYHRCQYDVAATANGVLPICCNLYNCCYSNAAAAQLQAHESPVRTVTCTSRSVATCSHDELVSFPDHFFTREKWSGNETSLQRLCHLHPSMYKLATCSSVWSKPQIYVPNLNYQVICSYYMRYDTTPKNQTRKERL